MHTISILTLQREKLERNLKNGKMPMIAYVEEFQRYTDILLLEEQNRTQAIRAQANENKALYEESLELLEDNLTKVSEELKLYKQFIKYVGFEKEFVDYHATQIYNDFYRAGKWREYANQT
jgi:hypothetical protein